MEMADSFQKQDKVEGLESLEQLFTYIRARMRGYPYLTVGIDGEYVFVDGCYRHNLQYSYHKTYARLLAKSMNTRAENLSFPHYLVSESQLTSDLLETQTGVVQYDSMVGTMFVLVGCRKAE